MMISTTPGIIVNKLPTVGLGVALIFSISGRGIMEQEAPKPLETLTLVPSSRYLYPTLTGFLNS